MLRMKQDETAARKQAGLLCRETVETLERAQSNRVFELENWRSLKLEMDKLSYILQKLLRQLGQMREARK